jgi:7-keto-8-aminopelargonate synthetase-like enzyme
VRALRLSELLFEAGINAQPILYPAVPEKESRVRIFMTAIHSEKQIRDSVKILGDSWAQIVSGNDRIRVPQPV